MSKLILNGTERIIARKGILKLDVLKENAKDDYRKKVYECLKMEHDEMLENYETELNAYIRKGLDKDKAEKLVKSTDVFLFPDDETYLYYIGFMEDKGDEYSIAFLEIEDDKGKIRNVVLDEDEIEFVDNLNDYLGHKKDEKYKEFWDTMKLKKISCRHCNSPVNDEMVCSNNKCNEMDIDNFYISFKNGYIENLYDYLQCNLFSQTVTIEKAIEIIDYELKDK